MRKHLLTGTFGSDDSLQVSLLADELHTSFPLTVGGRTLGLGMAQALAELTRLNVYPTELGLDFLILAAHVFATDTRLSRLTESQDTWTREIRLLVPVSDVDKWTETKVVIVRMLNFLTGDLWNVDFRKRPEGFEKLIPQKPLINVPPMFNKVQLYSGGLDSLIGTIDNIENNNAPLLISHAGDGATSEAQNTCYRILKEHYTASSFNRLRIWMNVSSDTFTDIDVENTTRGRSFLFFSLGVLAGTGLSTPFVLETPENGLIALNVPLDVLRLGSLSTHTTHPFYMQSWNELLSKLGINGKIENPYQFQTKGEMVDGCKNHSLLQLILPETLSCSSPTKGRWKGLGIEHCGYCLPCIIRRASLNKRSVTDNTPYTLADLTSAPIATDRADGQQIRSFQFAIDRLMKKPNLGKVIIHKSGPLPKDASALSLLSDVYYRGMQEVGDLLVGVITEPS